MQRHYSLSMTLAGALVFLAGCGGGSGGGDTGGGGISNFSAREILAGNGSTSANQALTTKRWKVFSVKVNGNYTGTGADQPCPAQVFLKSNTNFYRGCTEADYYDIRSDGKARIVQGNAASSLPFDATWSNTDNTFTIMSTSTKRVTTKDVYTLTNEGVVSGKQRLRVKIISETVDGNNKPEDVGFEAVIEEAGI
jgi:hypothetical protein